MKTIVIAGYIGSCMRLETCLADRPLFYVLHVFIGREFIESVSIFFGMRGAQRSMACLYPSSPSLSWWIHSLNTGADCLVSERLCCKCTRRNMDEDSVHGGRVSPAWKSKNLRGKGDESGPTLTPPDRRHPFARQRTRHKSVRFSQIYADIQKPSVGVCLSGGGIRSAMFCSGVLRQLLADNIRIDYLSSVSGGGYVAASYMDWKYREGGEDHPDWHRRYFDHILRRVPDTFFRFNTSLVLGVYDVFWHILGALLNTVGLSIITRACYFLPVAVAVDLYAGDFLRGLFDKDPIWDVTTVIAYLMLASCVFNALFHNMPGQQTVPGHILRTFCVLVGILCGITAKACAFEKAFRIWRELSEAEYQDGGHTDPLMAGIVFYWAVILSYLMLWVIVPGSPLRRRFVVLALMAIEGYAVQLRVFSCRRNEPLNDWMNSAIYWSAMLFLLHPILEPVQETMFFHVYK